MTRPSVTIAIPFYNPGSLLIDAVRSVFCQTTNDWDLILVDDGSSDGSLESAKRINDPRVQVVSDGKNLGLVARLNQISNLGSGEYLARMDADDLMSPDRIEKQIRFLESNRDVNLVSTGAIIIDESRLPVGVRRVNNRNLENLEHRLRYGMVIHAACVGKRSWFQNNRYDDRFPRDEDRELFVRTGSQGGITQLEELLYYIYVPRLMPIKSFLCGYRSERKVLIKYGPALVGKPTTIKLVLGSFFRSVALYTLCKCGAGSMISRRLQGKGGLSTHERGIANAAIRKIMETRIPGID